MDFDRISYEFHMDFIGFQLDCSWISVGFQLDFNRIHRTSLGLRRISLGFIPRIIPRIAQYTY